MEDMTTNLKEIRDKYLPESLSHFEYWSTGMKKSNKMSTNLCTTGSTD